ncbi:competence/damage-inducible protein A [Olivibacter ginsenosidimutans]|uniref:CinA-like protein n=1 Tax=Olivibacter ginsenosidimutans TaxID=1176537 RepID=A0ABP9CCK9_9SPHI
MKAAIITIGDEILIGQIVDTNSAWMAQQLNALGIDVIQISSIADKPEAIQEALTLAGTRADLILSTGGLGPTQDDVTKQTLASFFNTSLYRDERVLQHVEQLFKRLDRPMLETNRQQADVLANAEVLHNETGTAPGMWIARQGKIYVIMPGVPTEMKYLMEAEVLPRLRKLPTKQTIVHRSIRTAGIGESFLAEQLASFEAQLPPNIHLAYLPKYAQVKLRLTAIGSDKDRLLTAIDAEEQKLISLTESYRVGFGDVLLEQQILDVMQEAGLQLTVAESCTGGYLGHLLTSLPGSSAVFKGGGIVYSNELKMQLLGVQEQTLRMFGAVSEQVALEMAIGAQQRFGADYSIAITGIAGPDGGSVEKPVGTVWIALAGKHGAKAKLFHFGNVRLANIERSAANALVLLFYLLKDEVGWRS